MGWLSNKKVKYTLAGIGVVYLVLGVGGLIYFMAHRTAAQGPSELEAHPERQEEIRAQMRVEEMKKNLGLSDEQTRQLTEVFAAQHAPDDPGGGPGPGDPREHWRGMREAINKILTPEQQQRMEETRGQFNGRGGPGRWMTPERMDALKAKMTPDEKERFEKRVQEWQSRGGRPRRSPGQDGPRRPPR
jgi:hypothetical protein